MKSQLDADYKDLEPLMQSWMKKNDIGNKVIDGDKQMKYTNWYEDSEAAVRVYIKVTNRELGERPSNSILACAQQFSETTLNHINQPVPDKKVRLARCDKSTDE